MFYFLLLLFFFFFACVKKDNKNENIKINNLTNGVTTISRFHSVTVIKEARE